MKGGFCQPEDASQERVHICVCSPLHARSSFVHRNNPLCLSPLRRQTWARLRGYRSSACSFARSSAGLQPGASARPTRCPRPTSSGCCTASWNSWASHVRGWSIPRIRPPTSSDLKAFRVSRKLLKT